MFAGNKIKVAVIGFVLLLAGVFLYLKNNTDLTEKKIAQAAIENNFSVVPKNDSLLIAAHSPMLGPENAPITIVEFLDPECEACSAMYPVVKKLMQEFDGKILLVVRYMPFHGNSIFAANVLEAAREQGKYWEALAAVFQQQAIWASHHDPKPELIYSTLTALNLNIKKIKSSAESGKYNELIEKDKSDGLQLGVKQTPTFFVNGEELYEMGYEPLKNLILKKLN